MISKVEQLKMLKFDRNVLLAINPEKKDIINKMYDERAKSIVRHWHCDCHKEWNMCCSCDCGNRFGREYEKEDYYGD